MQWSVDFTKTLEALKPHGNGANHHTLAPAVRFVLSFIMRGVILARKLVSASDTYISSLMNDAVLDAEKEVPKVMLFSTTIHKVEEMLVEFDIAIYEGLKTRRPNMKEESLY